MQSHSYDAFKSNVITMGHLTSYTSLHLRNNNCYEQVLLLGSILFVLRGFTISSCFKFHLSNCMHVFHVLITVLFVVYSVSVIYTMQVNKKNFITEKVIGDMYILCQKCSICGLVYLLQYKCIARLD